MRRHSSRHSAGTPSTGARTRGAFARAALALLAALCAALLLSASALAADPVFVKNLDLTGVPGTGFKPMKVAVDQSSGDVYVADAANNVIDRFTSAGTYVDQITGADTAAGALGFGGTPAQDDLVVDNSSNPTTQGNLYAATEGKNLIFAFDSSGTELWEAPAIAGGACGVDVDANGKVWAGDYFSQALTELKPADGTATGTTIPLPESGRCSFAFDASGGFYSALWRGALDKFDASGVKQASVDSSETYDIAVDRKTGIVFTAVQADGAHLPLGPAVGVWDASGNQVSRINGNGTSDITGVAVDDERDRLYVADQNNALVSIYDIAPLKAPEATPLAATDIAKTTATLNAKVNPKGFDVTDCHFEYGPTTSYGSQALCVPATPISGTSDVAVSAAISGLAPNTTYHYRLVATNVYGTGKGGDVPFKTAKPTPPIVTTGAASGPTQTSATLNGTANPNGVATDCKLQYGTSTAYGQEAAATPGPGSGSAAVAVSASVGGLAAGTAYHFRLSCTSADGTTNGSDASFTTLAAPSGGGNTQPIVPITTPVLPTKPPAPLKCKKGFKKKTVKGKPRCVKIKKHHKRRHH